MTTTDQPASAAAGPARLLDRDELAAWRGLLRSHANLTRALDVDLVSSHGLPLTSYEVLLFLADSDAGRLRMSELADSVLLSRSGLDPPGGPSRAPGPAASRELLPGPPRVVRGDHAARPGALRSSARYAPGGRAPSLPRALHPGRAALARGAVAANDRGVARRPGTLRKSVRRPPSAGRAGAPRGWRAPAGGPPRRALRARAAGTRVEARSATAAPG